MWELANSKIVLVAVSFVLTTVCGKLIAGFVSTAAWRRDTMVALSQERYTEGTRFLQGLTRLIGRRFFALQRFAWCLESPDRAGVEDALKAYRAVLETWNERLWENRNKARLLVSD